MDNTYIFQDVDQDVLSEFQRSPIVQRNRATNWLNPASSCVTGYIQGGHSYHPKADKITSSIYSQLTWLGISVGYFVHNIYAGFVMVGEDFIKLRRNSIINCECQIIRVHQP